MPPGLTPSPGPVGVVLPCGALVAVGDAVEAV